MSKIKVLMLDDEPNVLSAYKRSVGRTFDLHTFEKGSEALDALRADPQVPVVVTDMRMPEMDGLQFVIKARSVAPDSIFVMLTGNADQQTAINAINQGKVFRFLNKPCEGKELEECIRTCYAQYQLLQAEKVLLRDTLAGSVQLMLELIAISNPRIAERAKRVRSVVQHLISELGQQSNAMLTLASSFSMIGCLAVHSTTDEGDQLDEETLSAAAATGERLLERIPRLKPVAAIVGNQRDNGMLPESLGQSTLAEYGGKVLCFAVDWVAECERSDSNYADGLSSIRNSDGVKYDPELFHAAERLIMAGILEPSNALFEELSVEPLEIKVGDKLLEPIQTKEGSLLLAAGCEVTRTLAERLRGFHRMGMLGGVIVKVKRPIQQRKRQRAA
jgi:CheY-like chemotaxis protein